LNFGAGITFDLNSTSSTYEVINAGGERVELNLSSAELENVTGTSSNDTITGNARDNRLEGGLGDDIYKFVGVSDQQGSDTLVEAIGAGTDTLDFSSLSNGVTIDLGSTVSSFQVSGNFYFDLTNALEIENAIGTNLDDTLTGNALQNRLEGLGGADTLQGLAGDDTYVFAGTTDLGTDTILEAGGQGIDLLDFSGLNFAGDGVTVNLASNSSNQQIINSGGQQLALNLSSSANYLENVQGTNFNDTITGNALANLLGGGLGSDIYQFTGTDDPLIDIIAEAIGQGDDTLDFSTLSTGVVFDLQTVPEVENVVGTAYDDMITSNARPNSLSGGLGNDTYKFTGNNSPLADTIFEAIGAGTDTLDFSGLSGGIDFDLNNTPNIENAVGTDFDDVLTGNLLSNTLDGGTGNDTYKFTGNVDPSLDTIVEAVGRHRSAGLLWTEWRYCRRFADVCQRGECLGHTIFRHDYGQCLGQPFGRGSRSRLD